MKNITILMTGGSVEIKNLQQIELSRNIHTAPHSVELSEILNLIGDASHSRVRFIGENHQLTAHTDQISGIVINK